MAVINTDLTKLNIYLVPLENFRFAIRKNNEHVVQYLSDGHVFIQEYLRKTEVTNQNGETIGKGMHNGRKKVSILDREQYYAPYSLVIIQELKRSSVKDRTENLACDLKFQRRSTGIFFLPSNQRMIACLHAKLHLGFA